MWIELQALNRRVEQAITTSLTGLVIFTGNLRYL
jgi:hypothetical protein